MQIVPYGKNIHQELLYHESDLADQRQQTHPSARYATQFQLRNPSKAYLFNLFRCNWNFEWVQQVWTEDLTTAAGGVQKTLWAASRDEIRGPYFDGARSNHQQADHIRPGVPV
jgi:hypothetical protein